MQQALTQILHPNVTDTGFWLSLHKNIDLILTCTAFSLFIICAGISTISYNRPYSDTKKLLLYHVVEYGNVRKLTT